MQRIPAIDPAFADAATGKLLNRILSATGMLSNQIRTMAHSSAVLPAYIDFDAALARGTLSDRERQRIALTVAQVGGCPYTLDVHCALGRLAGLSEEEIRDSRRGVSPDRRLEAMLQFARQLVQQQGRVGDADLDRLGRLGCDHGQIVEILANVMLVMFAGYFNFIARTARDFPRAPALAALEENPRSPEFPNYKPDPSS